MQNRGDIKKFKHKKKNKTVIIERIEASVVRD